MRRCFQLARLGLGKVAPNPMVGAVIVKDGRIIGEGYHHALGLDHAEIDAIRQVGDKAELKGSTLYVNLEPCTHYGRTPPCCDRIIESGISEVVFSGIDPSEKVSGKGKEKLEASGVRVLAGLLPDEENVLNRRFRTFNNKSRPYVILKWARSIDGFIDSEKKEGNHRPARITGRASQRLLHKWRSEEAAIMVGTNTAVIDNPRLNVRVVKGRNPLRICLDRRKRMNGKHHLLSDGIPTLVYTESEALSSGPVEYFQLKFDRSLLESIMEDLYRREVQSLIVEGGKKLLESFISSGIWDEARVFTGPAKLESGLKAPDLQIPYDSEESYEDDLLHYYFRRE